MSHNSMYAVQDVPGKGKGLVACKRIPKGTRILCEEPMFLVPRGDYDLPFLHDILTRYIEVLNESSRLFFLSLANAHPYESLVEQYIAIIRTNSIPAGGDYMAGIFRDACRINHACDNNTQKSWNKKTQRLVVYALRDIEKDEEITMFYLKLHQRREVRQMALQERFNFTCSCGLCSLSPEQSEESDRRLTMIRDLDTNIDDGFVGKLTSPLKILRYVDRQIQVYDKQNPGDSGLPRAFHDASQIAFANGDMARGCIFTERAMSGWRTALGDDSIEVETSKSRIKDMSLISNSGESRQWSTAVNDVPTGLEAKDFEDWLWRREKKSQQEELMDAKNREVFPPFHSLPLSSESFDLPQGGGDDGPTFDNAWCFLGEFVESSTASRPWIEVRDIDGARPFLYFCVAWSGEDMKTRLLKKGNTVAILCARQRLFPVDGFGILHDDPEMLKVFPMSLDRVLEFRDLARALLSDDGGVARCHGCGEQSASLKQCAKCLCVGYCKVSCQKIAWTEKGHKSDCKVLRDPDLRGLFFLRSGKFHGAVKFPLPVEGRENPSSTVVSRPNVAVSVPKAAAVPSQAKKVKKASLPPVPHIECPSEKLYEIKEVPGKGRGLVATRKIARGSCILAESPVVRVPKGENNIDIMQNLVYDQLKKLTPSQNNDFFKLQNRYGKTLSPGMGITKVNALPIGHGGKEGGVFLEASRLNHSCKFNAQHTWDAKLNKMTLYACRDIEAHDEITISYIQGSETYAMRQGLLRAGSFFTCTCELCMLPIAQRHKSDERLNSITRLMKKLNYSKKVLSNPLAYLRDAHKLFCLLKEEDVVDRRLAVLYHDSFHIAVANGDQARARVFAERAAAVCATIQGAESEEAVKFKEFAEKPSAHMLFEKKTTWRLALEKIPRGLGPREFEDWLWKTKEKGRRGK